MLKTDWLAGSPLPAPIHREPPSELLNNQGDAFAAAYRSDERVSIASRQTSPAGRPEVDGDQSCPPSSLRSTPISVAE